MLIDDDQVTKVGQVEGAPRYSLTSGANDICFPSDEMNFQLKDSINARNNQSIAV